MPDERPIGIFDSGLGGLTVLRAVAARLPAERLVYLGDTARVPYGAKSAATVSRYARQCGAFLREKGVKAVVVACNTASSVGMPALAGELAPHGIAALGVIEPGAVEACRLSRRGRIGVIGTSSTIRSGAYRRAILEIRPDYTVAEAACPLLVPLAEEGWTDPADPVVRGAAMRYLEPLAQAGVDTLILGCTHYPLLREVISQVMAGVTLVDSGPAVAHDLARLLAVKGIEAAGEAPGPAGEREDRRASSREARYFVTDDPERFRQVGARFLGHEIEGPDVVELAELAEPAVNQAEGENR